jgi:uncharacterized protein DUF4129
MSSGSEPNGGFGSSLVADGNPSARSSLVTIFRHHGGTPWRSPMGRLFCGIVLAMMLASPGKGHTQSAPGDEAIERGRRALGDSPNFPWYDAEQDAIQRIDVRPPQDLAARKSKWQPSARSVTWPAWLSWTIQIICWVLLSLVVLGLIFALTRALLISTGNWRSGRAPADAENPLHGDIDRIEALPFQLKLPQTDLLAQARRHYEAGEYGQAIIYLYSYQLIQLDRHQLIRLTKGKTNRQYLREVRPRRELRDLLSRSMIAFEDVFFGHHQLDRDRFESCWRRLDEFHERLSLAAV